MRTGQHDHRLGLANAIDANLERFGQATRCGSRVEAGATDHGLAPEGWRLVRAEPPRTEWRHVEGRGAVCVVVDDFEGWRREDVQLRRKSVRAHARRVDGDVPPGGGPGGVSRRLRRRDTDRRGRSAPAARLGLRALPTWHTSTSSSGLDAPCIVIAVGARAHDGQPDALDSPSTTLATRHGASVAEDTTDGGIAYASVSPREQTAYRDGWLPE